MASPETAEALYSGSRQTFYKKSPPSNLKDRAFLFIQALLVQVYIPTVSLTFTPPNLSMLIWICFLVMFSLVENLIKPA